MKTLLIKNDLVLEFKSEKAADKYLHGAAFKGETYITVKIRPNYYEVFNPYISGTDADRVSQMYTFEEVLKYCGAF